MARLAGVFASSHAPLLVRGWKDVTPAHKQDFNQALWRDWRIDCVVPDLARDASLFLRAKENQFLNACS